MEYFLPLHGSHFNCYRLWRRDILRGSTSEHRRLAPEGRRLLDWTSASLRREMHCSLSMLRPSSRRCLRVAARLVLALRCLRLNLRSAFGCRMSLEWVCLSFGCVKRLFHRFASLCCRGSSLPNRDLVKQLSRAPLRTMIRFPETMS